MSKKKKLAIAGATGFIGRWFIETYKDKYDIIALSRKKVNPLENMPSHLWDWNYAETSRNQEKFVK